MSEAGRGDLQALLEVYRMHSEELQGFRSTIFRVYSILVTILIALLVAIVQFSALVLVLVVPIPLALLFLASVAYSGWRWELIEVVANIEREISKMVVLPPDCRYQEIFVKRHKRGLPAGMERRSMQFATLVTIISLVLFYWILAPIVLK